MCCEQVPGVASMEIVNCVLVSGKLSHGVADFIV